MREVENALVEALARPLPGIDAQLRMAPRPRVGWDPHRIPDGLRDGAALLLIYPGGSNQPPPRLRRSAGSSAEALAKAEASAKAEDPPLLAPHLLLTVRGSGLRKHTGQVSFPGGAVDPNESIETAALREASEEVGVVPAAVRVLGRLTPVHIPVSGYLLHPVVGIVDERPDFRPAEWEVARILEVPVEHFDTAALVKWQKQTRQLGDTMVEVDVPYFEIDGEIVWGATAMILAEFLALLREPSK